MFCKEWNVYLYWCYTEDQRFNKCRLIFILKFIQSENAFCFFFWLQDGQLNYTLIWLCIMNNFILQCHDKCAKNPTCWKRSSSSFCPFCISVATHALIHLPTYIGACMYFNNTECSVKRHNVTAENTASTSGRRKKYDRILFIMSKRYF